MWNKTKWFVIDIIRFRPQQRQCDIRFNIFIIIQLWFVFFTGIYRDGLGLHGWRNTNERHGNPDSNVRNICDCMHGSLDTKHIEFKLVPRHGGKRCNITIYNGHLCI